MAFFVQIAIAIALDVVAYLLMPKPKSNSAATEQGVPTAEAGIEISVLFGTLIVKDPNCLWYGDKQQIKYKAPS